MIEDDIHIIQNDPLIIVDKFPYTKKKDADTDKKVKKKEITKIYFLTHFHADHYMNINKYFNENVFSSTITKKLLTNIIGVNEKYVHNLKINRNYYLFNFEIVFIDANHCPGSVIIYFEFANGTKIIHTGDFRYSNVHSFLIKKLLYYDTANGGNEDDNKEKPNDIKLAEPRNHMLLTESASKECVYWNNKKYSVCYVSENFNIYNSNTYIVDIEEFRITYLKSIEDLLVKLENMEEAFYLYDSIEQENYFNYFIFIELSLYFNQNELDILLLYDNDMKLNDSVIINKENIKNIQFVSGYQKKEELLNNENSRSITFLVKKELIKCKDNNEMHDSMFKKGIKIDNINREYIVMKSEKDNNINETQQCESVHTCQLEKMTKKKKRKCMNDTTEEEKNEIRSNIDKKFYLNEKKENSNYIRTIYLDTTYALSKNNLFAPQMYLINFIIYLCRDKIKRDSCVMGTEENNKSRLARLRKRIKGTQKIMEDLEGENKCIMYDGVEKRAGKVASKNEIGQKRDEKKNMSLNHIKSKGKKTLFLFGTYNLGKEKIYLSVSEACNMKIYYKNEKKRTIIESFLSNKNILNRITDNKLEAQIHIVDISYSFIFPKIENSKFRNLIDEDIEKEYDFFYYIIPTGWVKKYSFYRKNNISIFLIPYSEHSNLSELKDFVKSIKPCNIFPTVFSNPKEKMKILNIFNPYLNLKKEVYHFLKLNDESYIVKNKKISKKSDNGEEKEKKNVICKTKAEKILVDRNQQKLTLYFPITKREIIKKEK
ncbi:DNA repair metallo-beta-lactamase protein [Plasmodium brasilianum]|uniref:DNA repair metallo-beta-lactamase protein n=1 Tax=Plasmodium brasilianum TaxID=5824 RepID=A0ACB9Y6Z4_PLABR|nr:DNA repair metallo-beta-lactamase protein [Plasmodium brasilianum]